MEEKLIAIVKELLAKRIFINDASLKNNNLAFEIDGFAKSGSGLLYINEDGKICLETRYNRVDEIQSVEDIARVAYDWDCIYCSKDSMYSVYVVSNAWMELYKSYGFSTDNLK